VFARRLLAVIAPALLLLTAAPQKPALADPRLVARLNEEQRTVYRQWKDARAAYDSQHDAYWNAIAQRRAERRRKIGAGERVGTADFILQQPPKYAGPPLRADIARLMAELVPPSPDSEITTLPEVVNAARQHYRFVPALVPEREFKRRYALEALAVGLTKDEVTRIYAFETGGRGTFDMQAGINPDTKQGRAISTALGYAQLLAANSISELTQYGDGFIARLGLMATRGGTSPEQRKDLAAKIESIRLMLRYARSVPREWSRHVEMARSSQGYGIHALNLDGDVGPWLQVIKLRGIKDTAIQSGRVNLSPAELELMNLAGPRTGLEMMEPAGRQAPTANFFSRAAYYRNTIVREKTAAELLAAIDQRMNENMTRPGSVEFAQVFDEVTARGTAMAREQRQQLLPVAVAKPLEPQTPSNLVPPKPVRAEASQTVPPAPVPVARPLAPSSPAPRLQWAPPNFVGRGAAPLGFPE
jgi:hypothetical protein